MGNIIIDVTNRQHDFIDKDGNKVGPPQRVTGGLHQARTPEQVPTGEAGEEATKE